MPTLDEFERIAKYFAPLAAPEGLGLADDVALIDGPGGEQYVLKTDAIVEGVHFFAEDPPAQIAQKLLRVNLSDLAAKGARPYGYLLTMALPATRGEDWIAEFARGLAEDQARYAIALMGGDSVATAGPVALNVAALGRIPRGMALLRGGARPGHKIYVSGTLGDAALGLAVAKGGLANLGAEARDFLLDRFRLPQPRVALGPRLVGLAGGSMDISDGLVADLGHLCRASAVAARIEAAALPLSDAARQALAADPGLIATILGGGDDYELLFTVPPEAESRLNEVVRGMDDTIAPIGVIESGRGVRVLDAAGQEIELAVAGYRHF